MQSAMTYQSVDDPRNREDVPKRTWLKPAAIFTVVLVVCVGFLFMAGDKTNTLASSPNTALFAEKANAAEDNPMPAWQGEPIEDNVEAIADFVPGSVVGRGVHWVNGPRGWNCNRVCGRRRMSAVVSGFWPKNKKPFYVCAARGTRRHPGMRTGFNLPGWNNGKCAIAYGRWVNRVHYQCLCRARFSRSRWVSNSGRYSSCRRVCEKERPKMVAVSSGAYLNREHNPRYEVCAACRGFDCRSGWNLGLIPWGDYCVSPHGRSYTKTTGFKCFCAVPQPCRPRPPKRCPVRVRVIRLGALYRYWNARIGDHFYTRNAAEIGTTKKGQVGKHGYKSEGIACYLARGYVRGLVRLYRYWKPGAHADHFYTTNWREIGTRTPKRVGKYGYISEGYVGYCSPRAIGGTVPLFRYWNPRNTDHFYTTNWGELGAGRHGWRLEGIQCYVWMTRNARLVVPGLLMEDDKTAKIDDGEAAEVEGEKNEDEEENEELDADADLGETIPDTEFHIKGDAEETTQ